MVPRNLTSYAKLRENKFNTLFTRDKKEWSRLEQFNFNRLHFIFVFTFENNEAVPNGFSSCYRGVIALRCIWFYPVIRESSGKVSNGAIPVAKLEELGYSYQFWIGFIWIVPFGSCVNGV